LLRTCPAGNGGTFLYNTYTGQWKQGAPRPYAGHHIGAEVINNRLYLFGGLTAGGDKVRLTAGWTDWRSADWMLRRGFRRGSAVRWPFNRGRRCCCHASMPAIRTMSCSQIQIYDLATNSWSFGHDLPYAVGPAATANIGAYVYLCGGILQSIGEASVAVLGIGMCT